jgi:hypothetical protein
MLGIGQASRTSNNLIRTRDGVISKFGVSGLTPIHSESVNPPRVHECPSNQQPITNNQ